MEKEKETKKQKTKNIKEVLSSLTEGRQVPSEDILSCFRSSFEEEEEEKLSDAQLSSLLTALTFRKDLVNVELMRLFQDFLLSQATPFPRKGEMDNTKVVDIVGTGGDGHDTFNVSTASALVVAAVVKDNKNIYIAKHGNRSSSGKCGSADFIEALGASLESERAISSYEKHKFSFLFAPNFHPKFAAVKHVRKEVGFRTIFNLLGPLISPAAPTHMVLGVGKEELGPLFADILAANPSIQKAFVVHSFEGMDELSPSGGSYVWVVDGQQVKEKISVTPEEDFGLQTYDLKEVAGGIPRENADSFRALASGKGTPAHLNFVLLNASAALFACGVASDWKHGVQLAKEAIDQGHVSSLLQDYLSQ